LFSTRDTRKGNDTLRRLNAHLQKTIRNGGRDHLVETRVELENVLVDLTRLLTVKALAQQLLARKQRLDAAVWNAGLAGWTGIDYWAATKEVFTSVVQATTYPEFMIGDVGALAPSQLSGYGSVHTFPEPGLGKVFTANVFGHYMLTHWLAPLMDGRSRVVWISSTSALPHLFDVEDLQGVRARMAYESSKRLTDLLVLNSETAAARREVETFLPSAKTADGGQGGRPKMILTHPGIMVTNIVDSSWWMVIGMLALTYLSRLLGSPWQGIQPYKGAVSACFAVLAPPSQLQELEEREGKGKWGSACDHWGHERVARMEVEGWGFGGELGVRPSGSVSTSRPGRREPTKESREEFEEVGRRVWREMEALRIGWEGRLGRVEVDA